MKDSRERFNPVAELYDRHRPRYPDGLATWLAATTGVGTGGRVADLGCGTGISSRFLARHGWSVVGIEPGEAMLARARASGGGPSYQRGEAARTGLPDASIDLVTAAQAFHWFELEPTLAEIRRVLVPGGWVCAFWNLRRPGPFNDAYEQILLESSSEYAAMSDSEDARDRIVSSLAGAVSTELAWDDLLPLETVIGRARSASYVAHGVADKQAFEQRLREAHARHAGVDGAVVWPLRTVAVAWPRPA